MLDATSFGFPSARKRLYITAVAGGAGDPPRRPSAEARPVRDFCDPAAAARYGDEALRPPADLVARCPPGELDVATGAATSTKPFTANYGKEALAGEGFGQAGPLLLTEAGGLAPDEREWDRFARLAPEEVGRLRHFAPEEMLALLGYPPGWALPQSVPLKQQWRLIGNSINAAVAGSLIRNLLGRLRTPPLGPDERRLFPPDYRGNHLSNTAYLALAFLNRKVVNTAANSVRLIIRRMMP